MHDSVSVIKQFNLPLVTKLIEINAAVERFNPLRRNIASIALKKLTHMRIIVVHFVSHICVTNFKSKKICIIIKKKIRCTAVECLIKDEAMKTLGEVEI